MQSVLIRACARNTSAICYWSSLFHSLRGYRTPRLHVTVVDIYRDFHYHIKVKPAV